MSRRDFSAWACRVVFVSVVVGDENVGLKAHTFWSKLPAKAAAVRVNVDFIVVL